MKINWKARFKHKQFWLSLIALLVVLANQVAAIFTLDITIISEQLTNIGETFLMILALMGIIIDPLTEGISDSKQGLGYDKPKEDAKW